MKTGQNSPEAREGQQEQRRAKLRLALKAVLKTREGRDVFRWILEDAGLGRSSFNTDALTMAYNEGRRSVALTLRDRLRAASADYFRLLEEEKYE